MLRKYLITTIVLAVVAVPVMAVEPDHADCDESANMVEVGKMGLVNEETLQKHIDQMEDSLNKVRRSKAERRAEHRGLLRIHLSNMQEAMREIHNMKLMSGCSEAVHGASIDTRMSLVEKRLDIMQKMMEQMLAHQQEIERE